MEEVKKMFAQIQDSQNEQKEEMKRLHDSIAKINQNLDEKVKILQEENNFLWKKVKEQETQLYTLEKEKRKKNLLFFGVEEGQRSYSELEDKILEIINVNMGVQCIKSEIDSLYRLGKKKDSSTIRPVAVTFTTLGKKILILKNKNKLQNKTYYIKEDFPQNVLEIRKELKIQAEAEKQKGNKVKLQYDKLIILKNKNVESSRKRNRSKSPEKPEGTTTQDGESTSNQNAKKNKTFSPHTLPKNNKNTPENKNITQYLINVRDNKIQTKTTQQPEEN
ncbi:hypothetical protein NE865_02892 [Phthorimaea operculella]|nr:hypothetical protein NE865_02892 [Phthorimaea operculella]